MQVHDFVAVYGSLLSELHNHLVIEGAPLIGTGNISTEENLNMVSLGYYPALVEDTSTESAPVVEVYQIDAERRIHSLDTLEGFPRYYNRRVCKVQLTSGEEVQACVYFMEKPSLLEEREIVPDSDWRKFLINRDSKE